MNEKEYIAQVSTIMESTKDAVQVLKQVAVLLVPEHSPSNILPFIADLPQKLEWDGDYAFEYLQGQEFLDAQSVEAQYMLKLLEAYVNDYTTGNWYSYTYSATAKYEGTYEIYQTKVDLAPEQKTASFNEAEETAIELRDSLPDRFFVASKNDGPLIPGNYRFITFAVVELLHDKNGEKKSTERLRHLDQ